MRIDCQLYIMLLVLFFYCDTISVVPLNDHLKNLSIDYLQFAFRWMNNLLMRELPLRCVIRLWDAYLVIL